MKSTRFVEPFAKEVDYWERTLSYIMETIEAALNVQRQWLYLENIFFGEDIRKQLPKESTEFDRLTEEWIEVSSSLFKAKSVLRGTHYKHPPYLFNKLNKMNDKLEHIQRELERYLETKRAVFPRFYFISNDDMLEILGNAKKPEAVQPHMKKMFDNINKIKIGKSSLVQKPEAQGMFSEDGEYIEFSQASLLDGPSELWLHGIEKAMRITLKDILKPCRLALRKMLRERDKWLMAWCGQLTITSSQMQWTTDCTRALMQCKIIESKAPLKKLKKKYKQVLAALSELSRRDLQKISRLKTNALITIEIHAKDVIDKMYKASTYLRFNIGAFFKNCFTQIAWTWVLSNGSPNCASTGIAKLTIASFGKRTRSIDTGTNTPETPDDSSLPR